MKKVISLLLVLVLCFTLSACGNSDDENDAVLEAAQLYGTWEFKNYGDIQQVTFNEDGTYRQITKVSGYNMDHTDNFVINDNCLVLYFDEMGITYTYNVTFDGTDKMNFYNAGNGELIITYTRKK